MKFDDLNYDDPDDYTNLMIVDGLNLGFRYKHSGAKNFAIQYVNTVKSLAKSYQAKKVIVLGDGGSSYRKEIYPEYKANREELREKQTEQEEKDFKEFLEEINKAFTILSNNYLTMRYNGIEADDIAAYIVKNYSNTFEHVWLISSDKDWDLLVDENTSRFSFITRKEITLENWSEHYIYDKENHIDIKCLQGDKGDNIPGVEGIGEKRAYGLIREYGSVFDIYENIPLPGKQKFIQNLNNFKENLLLNLELMDLLTFCEDAISKYKDDITFKIEEYLEI